MVMSSLAGGLSLRSTIVKRVFDLVFSFLGLFFLWWLILITAFMAKMDTGKSGFFTQQRVGRFGKLFKVIKIRTMRTIPDIETTVTAAGDCRITKLGRFFRKAKIDELPQLINVLLGQMSFVGPRPDVSGFADMLEGDDQVILSIRPGITGPATLQYRNEEKLLASVDDPEIYNRDIIFPDKVKITREYIKNYTLLADIKYIFSTFFHEC